MHEWFQTFRFSNHGGRHGNRHPPIWKCSKCGTRTEDWQKPSDDMKIRIPDDRIVTCDEYVIMKTMEQ